MLSFFGMPGPNDGFKKSSIHAQEKIQAIVVNNKISSLGRFRTGFSVTSTSTSPLFIIWEGEDVEPGVEIRLFIGNDLPRGSIKVLSRS